MQPSHIRLLCIALAAALLSACSAIEPPRHGNYGGLAAIDGGQKTTPTPPPTPATGPNADACDVAQPTGICWYPASAKFHPDGERLIVNLCSNRHGAAYYCRMVEYQIKAQRWNLVPGQQAGKSYLYPAYSNDGRSLVFVVDDCANPWCRGGYGMGQLTTLPVVQAEPGQAARYGAMKRLPVHGATRPNFTPDDQSIVYWRGRHTARLASGRTLSNVSVYRYTPKTDTEEHFIPSLYTDQVAAYFTVPMSAPHFSSDGKLLRFSARHDSSLASGRSSLDQGTPDVQVRLSDGAYEGRRTAKVKEGLGQVFAEHPKLGYLAGPGNLRLVDAKTLTTKAVLIEPGISSFVDGDLDTQGSQAVGLSRMPTWTQGIPEGGTLYWTYGIDPRDLRKQVRAAPVLSLIDLKTKGVQALEWPNVESLVP